MPAKASRTCTPPINVSTLLLILAFRRRNEAKRLCVLAVVDYPVGGDRATGAANSRRKPTPLPITSSQRLGIPGVDVKSNRQCCSPPANRDSQTGSHTPLVMKS